MGWYFTKGTRDELIRELIEPQNSERISAEMPRYALHGNVLWSVVRVTAKEAGCGNLAPGEFCSYIRCDLLHRSGHQWGYHPLGESMHPYYHTCPPLYLEMAQVKCADWRKCACAHHQALNAKRRSAAVTARSSSLTETAS